MIRRNVLKMKVAKYCKDCNAIEHVNIALNTHPHFYDHVNGYFVAPVLHYKEGIEVSDKCNSCGSQYTFMMDTKTATVIAALAAKKYDAYDIGDGNVQYYDGAGTCIGFDKETTPVAIFNTLPDNWGVLCDPRYNADEMVYIDYDGIVAVNGDWPVDEILKWVESLPRNENISDCTIDDVISALTDAGYVILDHRSISDEDGASIHTIKLDKEFSGAVINPYIHIHVDKDDEQPNKLVVLNDNTYDFIFRYPGDMAKCRARISNTKK